MTYRMEDGTVVKTENASRRWVDGQRHDGHNWISLATGQQWAHETLYRSRKGRYWIEYASDWQGSTPHAEWVSPQEATRWLLANEHEDEMPDDLQPLVEDVSE